MSVFDWLQPKWKHSDPAVREQGVLKLKDQELLETIANNDASEQVRLAAITRITKESILARFACRNDATAMPAMKRLSDRSLIAYVSARSDSLEVRELAVDVLDDRVVLHRIANSDTDPRIRLRARRKYAGRDATREVIQGELSRLQPAQPVREKTPEISGTLDEVSRALVTDGRFRISGTIDTRLPGEAEVRELQPGTAAASVPAANPDSSEAAARFLALKRVMSMGSEEDAPARAFYEIAVWRTAENAFQVYTEEKHLDLIFNSATGNPARPGETS